LLSLVPEPSAFFKTSRQSILLTGGRIIDGSGRSAVQADLRIVGDQIDSIGRLRPSAADRVIDVRGMVVSPGFVDIHNHSESGLETDRHAASQVSQGVTTIAAGADGSSPWTIAEYLSRLEANPAALNVLVFVGHATVRLKVLGSNYNRGATKDEIDRMSRLVEQGMQEGAFGLSTGLEYDVGHASATEEVVALAKVAARRGGIYMSHIRDEADNVMSALDEAIRIGREARIPVQISHIKMGTVGVWNKAPEAVRRIEQARRSGVDVTADCYPYDAWSSTITVLVPSRRHDDPEAVRKGLADVGGPANILITSCRTHPDYEGKTLESIAIEQRTTPADLYTRIVKDGGAGVVCRSMKESDIRTFYKQPWVMVASDGGIGARHPRGAGSFPRVLGRFVRERRWLPLEEAIRKMTSAPARRLGLENRGNLRQGAKADVVVFDPGRITDRSTFERPQVLSEGVEYVFVNGIPVWEKGAKTGNLPGVAIRNH
jgi:N-acyl-D-amino-acid deacylase